VPASFSLRSTRGRLPSRCSLPGACKLFLAKINEDEDSLLRRLVPHHFESLGRVLLQYRGQGKSFTPQPFQTWLLFNGPVDLKRTIVATEVRLAGFRAQGRGPRPSGFEGVYTYNLPCSALFSSPLPWKVVLGKGGLVNATYVITGKEGEAQSIFSRLGQQRPFHSIGRFEYAIQQGPRFVIPDATVDPSIGITALTGLGLTETSTVESSTVESSTVERKRERSAATAALIPAA